MKNKLVITFDSDSEVNGIPECLIFDNKLDAEEYLLQNRFTKIDIDTDCKYFSFSGEWGWSGTGRAFWAKHY